jgi:hypothetical protein
MNLSAAQDMLVKTLRWRQSFDIDALMKEEFDPMVFGGPSAHVYRKDREGRPVIYHERCKGYDNHKVDSKDIIRYVRLVLNYPISCVNGMISSLRSKARCPVNGKAHGSTRLYQRGSGD